MLASTQLNSQTVGLGTISTDAPFASYQTKAVEFATASNAPRKAPKKRKPRVKTEKVVLEKPVVEEVQTEVVEAPVEEVEVETMEADHVPVSIDVLGGNENIKNLQQRIINLNEDADSITSKALSNASANDLAEYQETLVGAIIAIQEATGDNKEEDSAVTGFFKRIGAKVGLVDKVRKSISQNMIENASIQENIDSIFTSLEGSIQSTEKDMTTLAALQESLAISVEVGNEMVSEINKEIETLDDSNTGLMEKGKLDGLLRELKSINLVNANTANQINAQITTTSGLAQNLREVRPILKNLIKSQTLVALQNARMGQAKEVRDLVSGVLNEFVTKNNASTNATILDAIEYSGKTVIEADTIKELGTQHDMFVKELSHIVKDLNRNKLEYTQTVDRVTKQLGQGMKELPRLMAGDTSQRALPSPDVANTVSHYR